MSAVKRRHVANIRISTTDTAKLKEVFDYLIAIVDIHIFYVGTTEDWHSDAK